MYSQIPSAVIYNEHLSIAYSEYQIKSVSKATRVNTTPPSCPELSTPQVKSCIT